jgi:hypothetical protein
MSPSERKNQSSPPSCETTASALAVSPARPPAAVRLDEARERVDDGVEVGGNVEPEDLDVVADVSDHRHVARRDDPNEPVEEAGCADAACQHGHEHEPIL